MNVKTELIAVAVRLVADNTNLIRKPTGFEAILDEIVNGESYDRRLARNIEAESTRFVTAVKRVTTGRKFQKITTMK